MINQLIVYKGRTNVVEVDIGSDITTNVITSQIRAQPRRDSELIVTWTVVVLNAKLGLLSFTIDDVISGAITADSGYMDIKSVVGGEPYPVFDRPIEVEFRETVTT